MSEGKAYDASGLPMHGMGTASVTWWGTLTFMLLEGTGFALAIAVYLYLYSLASEWPLGGPPPDLGPGTAVTAILIASLLPNYLVSRWAERGELRRVRFGLVLMCVLGALPLLVRVFEFRALNVRWDANAYGSIIWVMLGLHTTHLLTDLVDSIVLAVLMFTRHGSNRRRFGDVQDNALYWVFIVVTWVPIYLCIYWMPRS